MELFPIALQTGNVVFEIGIFVLQVLYPLGQGGFDTFGCWTSGHWTLGTENGILVLGDDDLLAKRSPRMFLGSCGGIFVSFALDPHAHAVSG